MTTDWAADVKKYVSNADEKVIAGIVRYCGIALQMRRSIPAGILHRQGGSRARARKFPEKETRFDELGH